MEKVPAAVKNDKPNLECQQSDGPEDANEKDATPMETIEIEINSFDHVNLYNDNVDLPQIKPRTVNNREEFYIEIPMEDAVEISKEEARRAIGRFVQEEYQRVQLEPLQRQL